MAVLKEFVCKAHGPFEEFVKGDLVPKCPKGCSNRWVTREIRTAPAARGHVTGKLDSLQKDLAQSFNLTNLKADKEGGTSVMQELRKSDPNNMGAFWTSPKNINTKEFSPTQALQSTTLPTKMPTRLDGKHTGVIPEA